MASVGGMEEATSAVSRIVHILSPLAQIKRGVKSFMEEAFHVKQMVVNGLF